MFWMWMCEAPPPHCYPQTQHCTYSALSCICVPDDIYPASHGGAAKSSARKSLECCKPMACIVPQCSRMELRMMVRSVLLFMEAIHSPFGKPRWTDLVQVLNGLLEQHALLGFNFTWAKCNHATMARQITHATVLWRLWCHLYWLNIITNKHRQYWFHCKHHKGAECYTKAAFIIISEWVSDPRPVPICQVYTMTDTC